MSQAVGRRTRDMTEGSIMKQIILFSLPLMLGNVFQMLYNTVGPMVIMLLAFVGIRQIYLFSVTHFVANTPLLVGLGYPVGWTTCFILEVTYWLIRRRKWPKDEEAKTA